ncbi:MAG: FAD-dependent oxidoreductase, partial [Caldimonas sp.]
RLMRDAVLSLSAKHPTLTSLMSPRQHSANDYAQSPLNLATGSEASFRAGPRPGMTLAECPLSLCTAEGMRAGFLTELLGPWFTLLVFAGAHDVAPELTQAAAAMAGRAPLRLRAVAAQGTAARVAACAAEDDSGRLYEIYDAEPGTVYLVRPDGHLLARWRRPTRADLESAMSHAIGPRAAALRPVSAAQEAAA